MDNQYTVLSQLGEGVFGYVWKAIHHSTKEIVAIKQLKYKLPTNVVKLVEFEALNSLKGHPNIVELKGIIKNDNTLSYVFEYMEDNLLQAIRKQIQPPCEAKIKYWMYQILKATEYMHNKGYIHRDMKPENILINGNTLKLADFGMAKKMSLHNSLTQTWAHLQHKKKDCPCGKFTEYVCTRWYRAPELLVHSPTYTSAIDMWSVGTIMAELFRSVPLFPGTSEQDQLYKICEVFGAPNHYNWPEGMRLATSSCFQFPQFPPLTSLAPCIPYASPEALNLIQGLCTWDPNKRLTASQALQHPFFTSITNPIQFNQLPNLVKHTSIVNLKEFPFEVNENIIAHLQPIQKPCQICRNLSNGVAKNRQDITYEVYPNYISSYKQACNSIKIASIVG